VAIEEVVAGQVFRGRRTSLRAGSASQVFAGSRTASEDYDAGHRPGGSARAGHAFKTARVVRRHTFDEITRSGHLSLASPSARPDRT
jgi:hypothetical protein